MKNTYTVCGDITELHLTYKGRRVIALIDTADLERVAAFPNTWYVLRDRTTGTMYVRGKRDRVTILLHRWLLPEIETPCIDHINGDALDNRRGNLRPATATLNMLNRQTQRNNSSGVPGVIWHRKNGCWQSRIKIHGRFQHLGTFHDFNEAVAARERAFAQAMADAIVESEMAA